MRTTCDVAIVGGGLSGLALHAGLLHRGRYRVRLYEAAPELRTATGTLINLGDNSYYALDYLHPQIVPAVKKRGCKAVQSTAVTRTSKDTPKHVEKRPHMADLWSIPWAGVQNAIAEHVDPSTVSCSHKATGYTEDKDGQYVTVHFQDQEDVTARLVIAADGIRSALRATMLPQDPGPRYLGHMVYNAVFHNPDGKVVAAHEPGEVQFWRPGPSRYVPLQAHIIDAGNGYTYWGVIFNSEQPSFLGTGAPQGRPGAKARCMKVLEDAGFDGPMEVLQAIPESEIYERGLFDRIPLDELGGRMSSPSNRVVLMGDAAHAMHPQAGQGGRTAFEDAHSFVKALEAGQDKFEDVFSAEALAGVVGQYEDERLARVCRVQRYAAEHCGLESIRAALHVPVNQPFGEQQARFFEMNKWLSQYPQNPQGDPESVYWKPVAGSTGQAATAPA